MFCFSSKKEVTILTVREHFKILIHWLKTSVYIGVVLFYLFFVVEMN